MRIEHLAIWAKDLELLKQFYTNYFGAQCGPRYHNPRKNFTSYFLSFDSGCRLEIMHLPNIEAGLRQMGTQSTGLAHFAISVGSRERVDELTHRLHQDGFAILDGPRTTGDGYYESVTADPEGNRIEITI